MDRATECPNCGLVNYPRIAPAVIVAVERGDELLLARNANFPAAFFSVLAGFVEAGESLEETVRRELREEVSIEVKDIRYFGSQSWPFPNSLMVGFTAQYASGEICVDTERGRGSGMVPPRHHPARPAQSQHRPQTDRRLHRKARRHDGRLNREDCPEGARKSAKERREKAFVQFPSSLRPFAPLSRFKERITR